MLKVKDFLQKHAPVIIICLTAIITMTLLSKNSFLYLFNDWDDANCYRYNGRQISQGLTPYVDLFEQKGPTILYTNAVLSYISDIFVPTTDRYFLGFYLMDIISAACYLLFAWKTIKIINNEANIIYAVLPAIIYSSNIFRGFGSFEGHILPLLAYMLYTYVKAYKNNEFISKRNALIQGVMIYYIFWGKYTILGVVLSIYLCYGYYCLKKKSIKEYLIFACFNFISFVPLSIGLLLFMNQKHALQPMIESYFINNIFNYNQHIPMINKIIINAIQSPIFLAIAFSPLIASAVMKRYRVENLLALIGVYTTTFMSKTFGYYEIPLSLFTIFLMANLSTKLSFEKIKNKSMYFVPAMLMIMCLVSPNTRYMAFTKEDYLPFLVQNDVRNDSYSQIISLDMGCRTVMNLDCDTKYIGVFNVNERETVKFLLQSVIETKYEYVLVSENYVRKNVLSAEFLDLYDEYKTYQITTDHPVNRNYEHTYCLFKLKEI